MNDRLVQLAKDLALDAPANELLRLRFAHACVSRVEHLLENPVVIDCLRGLGGFLAGTVDRAQLAALAAQAARLANQHQGSRSIDGVGHAAVSATYAVANALAGKALQAADYAAYAMVYGQGGYGAVADRASFEPEFEWQVAQLATLAASRQALQQSGLVIVVPEAEARFGEMRRRLDPQAALGVPAHITILFPFMPPHLVDAEVRRRLVRLFKKFSPFQFRLAQVGRFAATAYLAPVSPQPFIDLTNAVAAEFPDYPPYGGAYPSVIPHLTIADGDANAADIAEKELRADIERNGPVSAHCGAVRMLENTSGTWQPMHDFALAGHQG